MLRIAAIGFMAVQLCRAGFFDPCNALNDDIWCRADWTLGRGAACSENVGSGNGLYYLTLNAGTFDGAEFSSRKRFGYGRYRASLRCPRAPGSISSIFLYEGVGKASDEVDIEIYNDGTRRVDFVVWLNGQRVGYNQCVLSFDPAADFHEYAIQYAPAAIAFFVDRQLAATYPGPVAVPFPGMLPPPTPKSTMRLEINCWWPDWLSGDEPTGDRSMLVDWVAYDQ